MQHSLTAKYAAPKTDDDGVMELVFAVEPDARFRTKNFVAWAKERNTQGKPLLTLDIKPYRKHRSLNANAYMWVLLEKMAEQLRTSKDEVYIEMLARYGKFTHVVVVKEAADAFVQQWRTARTVGEHEKNGRQWVTLQCYFGSSTYDTKEMTRLLDGIISECRDMGIDTDTVPFDWSELNAKPVANG